MAAMAIPVLKLAVVFGFCMLIHHCQAVQHTVGGTTGWTLTTLNYSQWAAQSTYKVGDTLLFVYVAGDHSVLQVSKADHDTCNTASPLKSYTGGRTVVTLSQAGNYWFICGVPGHCPIMAFGVTVTAATAAAPPPSVTSTSPPPASSPSTSPPPASSPSTSPIPSPTPSVSASPIEAPSPSNSTPPTKAPSPTVASPPTVSSPPPSSPGVSPTPPPPSGSSSLVAQARGNAFMLLLGMVALVFCSVLHPF